MNARTQTAESLREARKRQVALGYRVFAALGWGDLGDGHISARDPERADCFWLLDVGTPFGEAAPEKLVLVQPDGSVVGGSGKTNLPAYYIHHPISCGAGRHRQRRAHPHRLRHPVLGIGKPHGADHPGGLHLLR